MTLELKDYLLFYSHVNFSVTKINSKMQILRSKFYSHVNFSVTKMTSRKWNRVSGFYSHVNFSVTKIDSCCGDVVVCFTVT